MVTLITEKLRNQSLSELSAEYAQIPSQIAPWSPSSPPPSAFHLTEKWTLYVDQSSSSNTETKSATSEISYHGSHPPEAPAPPPLPPSQLDHRSATTAQLSPPPNQDIGDQRSVSSTLPIHKPHVSHCDSPHSRNHGNNPPAPPKKRHCRSLSIPGDGSNPHKLRHTQQGSVLLRPVAVRPHLSNNKLLKNRNSPLGYAHHHRACTSPLNKNICSSPLQKFSLTTPTACFSPQSASHGSGVWSAVGSDYFSTPPESPVPRPASVSSGYCDSTLGPFLNAPWLTDQTQAQSQTASSSSSSGNLLRHSWDCSTSSYAFANRSLSLEEQISDSGRSSGSASYTRNISACTESAGSMPVMPGSTQSTPPSPQRPRRPRCRSQPCILLDRRCGVKRRRDEERPSLNFSKMTETAYSRRMETDKGINIPHSKCGKSSRNLASMFSEKHHNFAGLMTIASSPMDTNLPSSLVRTPPQSPTLCPQDMTITNDLTDSGCSDVNEPADDSCLCDHNKKQNEEEEEDEFTHKIYNDLDLDQIEKD